MYPSATEGCDVMPPWAVPAPPVGSEVRDVARAAALITLRGVQFAAMVVITIVDALAEELE